MGLGGSKAAPPIRGSNTPSDPGSAPLEIKPQVVDIREMNTNKPVYSEVVLTNVDQRKVRFRFDPVIPASLNLEFTPAVGVLDRGRSRTIRVTTTIKERKNLNFKITLRIDGAQSLFINMRVTSENGVFGVDPRELEQIEDGGRQVPVILANLRKLLVEKGGQRSEGIFRLAGEQNEIARLKDTLNQKKYDAVNTNDVNAIASLMKIWFRDLPTPILNVLPDTTILNFHDATDCIQAYNSLPEPQKTLTSWLLDFLVEVSSFSAQNKMTAQNIAIVIAPNLYDISTPNPMEGLILSQKCAQFLFQLLNSKIAGAL